MRKQILRLKTEGNRKVLQEKAILQKLLQNNHNQLLAKQGPEKARIWPGPSPATDPFVSPRERPETGQGLGFRLTLAEPITDVGGQVGVPIDAPRGPADLDRVDVPIR